MEGLVMLHTLNHYARKEMEGVYEICYECTYTKGFCLRCWALKILPKGD